MVELSTPRSLSRLEYNNTVESRPRVRSFSQERPRRRRPSATSLDLQSETVYHTATIHRAHSLSKMAALSLKISIEGGKVVKTIQFDPSTTVYDACRIIREKILEASSGDPKEYGLFLASEEDNKKGIWLEASRSLDYYMLRNGDLLEYNKKTRNLRVRMLDGTVKTLLVDDSQVVANLMVVICTKIGITNYDEYGLVREEQKEEVDPCEKPNFGTLTLKRKHQEKERDAKMEQLRKKLRTDDEVNWVEPSKTLREQGIDVTETLLLRRKLFFSDRNVDSRDPVQLNLLYVQARDAILDGTHPVTMDKACEFAGIQCQIQFGDHREDKHTPGFLDLKEFLPASYVKVKGIEKKIFKEHKKHVGLSELDAKVLYTKSARDLKTYGVAFFLVKEKMKGKNKLVPRLLGVTKDSVLRLDEKTKEILQTWPLTTVRRWCASPNTFTLDFGDYSDQYYSVQTTEAEQILQVIAGYIDIIVRKQRAKDHLGIEGDEGSAMLEDSVSPSKANIIQHDTFKSGKVNTESVAKPAVHRPGAEGAKPFAVNHMTGAQQTTVSGQIITGHTPPAASQVQQTRVTSILSEPQRALLSTISSGVEIIKHTEEGLTRATLPALGQDAASVKWKQVTMDTNKQVVTSQIAAMNAATAQVVTLTSGTEEVDHTAVGAAITTITTNLPEMTKGVQMIAALMDDGDHGDKLLDATRKLCTAFTDLLKAAEPETKEPRQNLLNAASRVGEASTTVLYTIGEETEEDKETQVIDPDPKRNPKKSYLYRKLNYCYDNFYKVFFGKDKDDSYDTDFENIDIGTGHKDVVDDGIYEDVDTTRSWGLDVIQEESDSDYYRSIDYCNMIFKNRLDKNKQDNINGDFESIVQNCEGYLDSTNSPKLYPKTIYDKIYNFKKDFSNHDYANVNFDKNNIDKNNIDKANINIDKSNLNIDKSHYENVDFNRRTKNDILREQFFRTDNIDKNDINDKFNRYNGKKIECHSIVNDVTKSGPDVKVSGALNMKLLNLDKYNRVLTTTETFMETADASFTKNQISKLRHDGFENFVKKSERYYTTETGDRQTDILNNGEQKKPKTEIRIFYNPTFRCTGENLKGFYVSIDHKCTIILKENLVFYATNSGMVSLHPSVRLWPYPHCQDILLSLAKAVANTTAALVLKAKNVAAQCREDQPLQNSIIAAATHCALATSQLVACAKVVAPTLQNPQCRSQLSHAARQVASAVQRLLDACSGAPPPAAPAVESLTAAAHNVTQELERLLAHCELERRVTGTVSERSVESVMCASERVVAAAEAGDMVRHARLLGQATAHLITTIKTEAEKQPSEGQRKLLAAAKLLADATARMVEAARQCASEPQDREKQEALRKAAEELRYITVDYAQGQDIVGSQVARLQESARQAASSATQLITSAHNATQYNTNKYTQETLIEECKSLNEQIPRVVDAVKVSSLRPADPAAQLDLISASEAFLQPSGHVIAASRGALPTVGDGPTAKHLADTTHSFTTSAADLRSAVGRARISCKGLELDAAAEIIKSLQAELDELEEAARALELRPLPSQTAEWASSLLQTSSRQTAASTAALVSGARRGEQASCARAAGDMAQALRDFSAAIRAVAALQHDAQRTQQVITSGRQVLYSSQTLVEHVKRCLTTSETVDTASIMSIAKDISQGLEATLEAVPSHTELDVAMENINETLNILNMGEFPPSDKSYGELQSELNAAAVGLSSAASDVAQSVDSPPALAASGAAFGGAFNRLLGVSMEMAGHTEDRDTQTLMVSSMKSVTVNSSKLLGTAKSVSQDLTRPNAKNQLAAAARAVTESINRLVDVCTEAAPGQKECSAAIRSIRSTAALLAAADQPLSELGYFACLDAVVDHSKSLSEGMSLMASSVKRSEAEQFSRAVGTVATAVQGLVECTAQAAYLVAVSDETSVAGRPGLVDQAQFARAAVAIEQACRALCDSSSNQQQVLSAATVIAKHTSALCNACRVASGRTGDARDKRHFVQAAKDVANSTAALVKDIKALDTDYSQENRARCAASTGPLQDAVRSLCQFVDSPEFASIPAKISPQARNNQEAILECGRNIISGSCSMLESARLLGVSPGERSHWQQLAQHSKTVSDSIKGLVANIKEKAPGQRECLAALETLNRQLRELDQAAMQAVGQELLPRKNNTLQGYTEQMENSATEMLERLEPLRVAANGEAENLGHAVVQLVSYAEPLVTGAVGASSNLSQSETQAALLEHARTVLETLALLMHDARAAAGNPRAVSAHSKVESQVSQCRAALGELQAQVRELSAARGAVGPLLDSMQRAIARLTDHRMSLIGSYDESDSFVDYQTRMVGAAKEIARLATDMTAKSATDASRLVQLGNEMCQKYEQLAQDSVGASATTPNSDIANRIRVAVVELGEGVSELIKAGGHCRLSAIPQNQRAVADSAKIVNEKVIAVLSALQAGSRGTQACIDAAATIAAIIGDLDTTILFASAGTLHSEKESDTFSDHRENILKTAKTLVEDTKTLVGGAAGTQEQLASAAQSAVSTIVQLCEVVKLGAMSLGSRNPEPQVLLLHAARDVAAALRDLAAATTAASGKHVAHPDMHRLKHAAKVMVTNVTSLLKTVKAVEDEHTRGTRALESTIEAISQEIEVCGVLMSSTPPKSTATPEELIRCTRQMTVATARAVSAGNANKQDQLTAAANLGRKTVVDLLVVCKGAAHAAETEELRTRTLEAGRAAAQAYRALLQGVLAACGGDAAARHHLPDLSRHVAHATADIIATAELLKGSDWVDPDDPTVIAENELLGAAASIDAAAKKLESLRPRKSVKVQEADESLNFDEMILEAAKSIITATSALVRAASAAQRELIDQGKVARRPTSSSDDGQWSEGLISAARLVAAAAHSLVEAANALVQGAGSEERLISSARQVASSTAQLLVACKVKADPSSESTRRLQAAGAEVIRSTDNLVRAARDAIHTEDERSLVLNRRMVGGIAQEIDARSEVLRIEKELEEARGRLTAIRQAKYKLRAGETSGEDTDTDVQLGYTSDTAPHRFKTPNSSFANTTYSPNSTYSPHTTQTLNTTNISSHITQLNHSIHGTPAKSPVSPSYYSTPKSPTVPARPDQYTQSFNQEKQYTVQSPSFSSFRPAEEPKQNYEGFTTRYETRLYDTPRPLHETTTERQETLYDYKEHKYGYEPPKTPLSPKFNARELKFDDKEPIYSTLKKPFDGVGQTFSEHQKSSEAIPGGVKHSEFKVHSESYQSYPKTEYSKTEFREEVKSPFASTPKFDRSTELVKAATPDYDRIASPYKESASYGGPNYMEETTTEVKEIPNGTQKITTTKIYSSSPVNLTTTNTKYEPIRLDGIDELSKSFDNDSKYSTLDSRFNTLESKMSSDTSRSFMRPSEFQSSDYQSTTNVTKVKKPSELAKEIDSLDKKFSKQTITSETIERKSVMTSSHKSESSSTITKKFGNF
ncbi:unnamed protein product [Spodoptera exigua]|nr:unnamed protein product [Spodoptera exigua]